VSVAVPDRRLNAPKPERGRRAVTAREAEPEHRELRWTRHRDEWRVELVTVVSDGSGRPPV
jgi:hypothetical protein